MRDIRSVTVWGDSVMKGVVYDEDVYKRQG